MIVSNRMSEAKSEIEHWKKHDYVLVNREFESTLSDIRSIVKSKRLEVSRNPSLKDFVRGLNIEFEKRK